MGYTTSSTPKFFTFNTDFIKIPTNKKVWIMLLNKATESLNCTKTPQSLIIPTKKTHKCRWGSTTIAFAVNP